VQQDTAPITAKAKGRRLQHLRKLAGLSRQQLCDAYTFNRRTLKSWELGDYKGIPATSAKKVLKAYLQEGIQCELEWLMYGTGHPPVLNQKNQILRDLETFRQNNTNSIDLLVNDDSMEPCFYPGDYVAGIKRTDEEIKPLLRLNCIVETEDQQILLRKLDTGSKENHYTISCLNPNTKTSSHKDIKLKSAAQVIWMRREEIIK